MTEGQFVKAICFLLVLFVGMLLSAIGGHGMYQSYNIDHNGITRIGRVENVEHIVSTDMDALVSHVKFDYLNHVYSTYNKVQTSDTAFALHEQVVVKFLPEDPEAAVIDSERGKYACFNMFIIILGTLFLIANLVMASHWLPSKKSD